MLVTKPIPTPNHHNNILFLHIVYCYTKPNKTNIECKHHILLKHRNSKCPHKTCGTILPNKYQSAFFCSVNRSKYLIKSAAMRYPAGEAGQDAARDRLNGKRIFFLRWKSSIENNRPLRFYTLYHQILRWKIYGVFLEMKRLCTLIFTFYNS